MTDSTTFKLNEIDSEDISDVLIKIQKSFGIKFGHNDFEDCRNYGDLCDAISSHLNNYYHLNDCTSQQAFYKIRDIIKSINPKNTGIKITPNTSLEILFPKSNRRKQIKLFKQKLGFKVQILSMQDWLSSIFAIGIIASIILFFFNWQFALSGLLFFITLNLFTRKFNNELKIKTVGDLTKMLVSSNYFYFRRNKNTINKHEIQSIIDNLFIRDLGVDKIELYKEALLGWG